MHKFPSIDQFRNVIKSVQMRARYVGKDAEGNAVYNPSLPLPTLTFRGTVKLHGTNAGIVLENRNIFYQSRERILSLESDNSGFMAAMVTRHVHNLIDAVRERFELDMDATICIYGEWCGQGIQRGVAISSLPKMFVIFAVKANDEWKDISGLDVHSIDDAFYNITQFPTHEIQIDFNNPQASQNALVEITTAIEEECPVGKALGATGIGEGAVWWCVTSPYTDEVFKVKGEKHSVTNVKTLAPVDIERLENINAFVAATVTEARLEQGLSVLTTEMNLPFEMKSMGDFIRWVFNDIMKEEGDTADANGLDRKALGSPIATKARQWYAAKMLCNSVG